MTEVEIVIVGAGVAGIAAATKLLENGFTDFVVLEAADRIGGRVHSVQFGKGVVDLGAEWVHGQEGNVVYNMVKPLDLLFQGQQFFHTSRFAISNGGTVASKIISPLFQIADDIYYNLEDFKLARGSLGDFMEKEYWGKVKPLIDEGLVSEREASMFLVWAEKMFCSIVGSPSWKNVSVSENTEYVECGGNQLQIWKQSGYTTVLDLLTRKIPNPSNKLNVEEKVLLNKEVKLINWQNHHVETTCADNTKFKSHRVIYTASLGVLKATYTDLFLPTLPPSHLNAIKGLGISVIDKIFLEFPYHWWPTGTTGISCIWTPEDLEKVSPELSWTTQVFGFYRNDSQPLTVLCGWVSGEAAAIMEVLSESELKMQCMALLRRFAAKDTEIPEPVSVLRSSWHSNPHIRGSYSYRTLQSDLLNAYPKALASPICNSSGEPVILFAGEATSDHYFSTVHGAIETGWREADRFLKLRNCENSRVVVVGAGIAGLAAAKHLVANGVDTIVLEAQRVAGGRILSVPTECGWIDLGAQWLHGENTAVCQIAAKNDLLSSDVSVEGLGRYYRVDGNVIPQEIVEEVAELIGQILESCERFHENPDYPSSIHTELVARFQEYMNRFPTDSRDFIFRQELFEWHKRFLLIDNSCYTLSQLSAKAWGLYENCGGKHCINFKECYKQLIDVIVADLPTDTVRLNKPVQHIEWSPYYENKIDRPRVKVWGHDFVVNADHVIVTCSLGYLKKHANNLFKPQLPLPLIQAIQCLGFATLVKLFVLYKVPWWSKTDEGFQFAWDRNAKLEEAVPWSRGVQGFDVIAGRPALLCWVGGPEALVLERTKEEDIFNQVTFLLHQFTGNYEIPRPSRIYRSQWHENEYILGAYSHVTPACDELDLDQSALQSPVYSSAKDDPEIKVPTILLAGEACSSHHYSTVHGAFESGEQQAQIIVDFMRSA